MKVVEHDGGSYVIAADLAAYLGISRVTVYMAIKRGALPSVIVLGRRLVPVAEATVWQPRKYNKACQLKVANN